jgi:hypothetical protein
MRVRGRIRATFCMKISSSANSRVRLQLLEFGGAQQVETVDKLMLQ